MSAFTPPPEEWRPTYLRSDYEVSNHGRVRHGDLMLKFSYNKHGYPSVSIRTDGKRRQPKVASLVIRAFVPCPTPGLHCRHKDGNPNNSTAWNLEWGTIKENAHDRIRHGTQPTGEWHGQSKLTEAMVLEARGRYAAGDFFPHLAKAYGVSIGAITAAVTGETWRHLPNATPSRGAGRLDAYLGRKRCVG